MARDKAECWSVAYVEARQKFDAERAWLRPALLRIRIEDGKDVRIDDGFVALGLHLDEVRWRADALQRCMRARGYAPVEALREPASGTQLAWRAPVANGSAPGPTRQIDAPKHQRDGDEVVDLEEFTE